jgi:uncharacterized membrane protein HdeD (DUF308 family)
MTSNAQDPVAVVVAVNAASVRKNWVWFLALGIVQIIAGTLAVSFAFSATLASVVTLGVLFLIAGGAQMTAALLARDWDGFFLFLLLAILYLVAGVVTLQHPLLAAEGLTLMLAALFLVVGLFRIAVALVYRVPSWRWLLFNGVVTVLLGLAIWQKWPKSGLWVVGMLVGIELIVNGVTWSVLFVGMRKSEVENDGRESSPTRVPDADRE